MSGDIDAVAAEARRMLDARVNPYRQALHGLVSWSPNYHPGQYTSPRTEPFVLGHITWPDGNLRIVQEEAQ